MITFFKTYFWNLLPKYFKQDNYNDSAGNPLLKRYLQNFGDELDEQVIPLIDNYINIFNLITTDDKFLSYISYTLGSPAGIANNNNLYRLILANAIQIYKNKGNKLSYQLYFKLIGIDIDIIEEAALGASNYDNNQFYDEEPVIHYDEECETCSGYWIAYRGINGLNVTNGLLNLTKNVICLLEPINANFLGFIPMIVNEENIDLTLLNHTNQ